MSKPPFIKVAVIGALGAGKTSLIRRFSHDDFVETRPKTCTCQSNREPKKTVATTPDSEHSFGLREPADAGLSSFTPRLFGDDHSTSSLPTSKRYQELLATRCTCNRPRPVVRTVVWGTSGQDINLVDISVLDVPYVEAFPKDTLQEFDTEGARGVRSASVYVLVFDVARPDTFEYISKIRDEIKQCCSRRERQDWSRSSFRKHSEILDAIYWPLNAKASLTLGGVPCNKRMRFAGARRSTMPFSSLAAVSEEHSSSNGPRRVSSPGDCYRTALSNGHNEPVILVVGNKLDLLQDSEFRGRNLDYVKAQYRELVNTVRKSWKCHYTECSAKYGYNVKAAFFAAVENVLVAKGRRKKSRVPKHKGFRLSKS